MWCSKIRQALANFSPQAGNVIHPFPFRQTAQFSGSTKALLLPLNLKHSETYCSSVDLPFYISYLDVMDRNSTYSPITWPPKFWEQITIAFTVSMVVGLVIGGIIWALFTCLSRRRASAHISHGGSSSFSRRSRPSSHGHTTGRTGFYRNSSCERRSNLSLASLTFQRQASLEQANSFPRKSSFRASTFHPFLQCPPLPVETNSQLITLTPTNTTTTLVGSTTNSLSRPEFHWSNNNLRICHSTQTPPPAYETIIKAFPDS
ncbi:myc target protein 1 isoform X1 [Indicator indicator]|uniref:myc target protein 1 isoform X1 n=1 Tax=Indicator indicator TaxID=1002788 RepID=UPI0023DF3A50|nr:myc target protein 1 isoform X1 [Indicator indicator]